MCSTLLFMAVCTPRRGIARRLHRVQQTGDAAILPTLQPPHLIPEWEPPRAPRSTAGGVVQVELALQKIDFEVQHFIFE